MRKLDDRVIFISHPKLMKMINTNFDIDESNSWVKRCGKISKIYTNRTKDMPNMTKDE